MADPGSVPGSGTGRPTRDEFLVFGAPDIREAEIQEVVDTLRSGWIGTGPRTTRFEEAFAAYVGTSRAVAVNSCTAALHLALVAADLGPDAEVITTPLTFGATANAVLHAGATPVLADVDPGTWNLDPERVEAAITPRTRAILPVHYAGRACDMDALMDIARRHDLRVIEDCAHAVETEYRGRKAGTFGMAGCFSFYVTKNVVTGEGGMLTTSDDGLAERLRVLSLHGMTRDAWKRFGGEGYRHYQFVEAGYKYNMMDLQAALGLHQLARVDETWERRREIWARYQAELRDLPLTLPAPVEPDTRHAYHLYTVLVDEDRAGVTRDQVLDAMTARRIGVGVHYQALPEHPFYQRTLGWDPDDVPHATDAGRRTLSLPLSSRLTDADVADVVAALRASLAP